MAEQKNNSRLIDITGKRYGRLVVLSRAENSKNGKPRWFCQCDCGNTTTTTRKALEEGSSKSCGCYRKECASKHNSTHGKKGTRIYGIWSGMKDRTLNPNSKHWKSYGQRGITVCDEWKSFEPFYEWAISNGYNETLTLDRIDVDGNYDPTNCRWATYLEQENNRRNTRYCFYENKKIPVMELSRFLGESRSVCLRKYGV